MEEKNIALLGFISAASDYLKNQMNKDPEKIERLNTINLDFVKDELENRVSTIFDGRSVSSKDLIDVGKKAFDDFINEKKPSLIDEFSAIFDIDFNDKEDEITDEMTDEITAHLLALLSQPEELEKPVIRIEEKKEIKDIKPFEKINPNIYVINRSVSSNEILKDLKYIIDEKMVWVVVEEREPKFDTSVNHKPFIKEDPNAGVVDVKVDFEETFNNIRNIVDGIVEKKVIEEESLKFDTSLNNRYVKEDPNAGVVNNTVNFEDIIKDAEEIVDKEMVWVVVEDEEPKFNTLNSKKEDDSFIYEAIESLEDLSKQEKILTDKEVEDEFEQIGNYIDSKEQSSYEEAINDEVVDEYVKIIAQNVSRSPEEDLLTIKEAQAEMDNVYVDIINHEDNNDKNRQSLSSELCEIKNNEYLYEPILNPAYDAAIELEKQEALNKQEEAELEDKEETVSDDNRDYVARLLDEFANSKIASVIEENIKKEEEESNNVFNQISRLYPYLADSFIKSVYSLKEQIAEEYGKEESVILLHRLNFEDVDGLRKFVELVLQHDYLINADEEKKIVDVFKKHRNVDGKILTDIFEIANQAKLLLGEYEGYRVITGEESN